jgi:DNA-binding transcriptional LysR family regulator
MATPPLDTLKAFAVVAQLESFTKAALRLGLDKSQLSRTVRALEARLKVALLVRTTRSVRLTPAGQALLARVAPLLSALEDAVAATPDSSDIPRGEVVITTTYDLGHALLAPSLVDFRARFPSVRVRVQLGEGMVDLMREGVDLALRVGKPGGEGLVARKLCELEAGFFASSEYLARKGTPTRMEDLRVHETLWPAPVRGQRSFAPGESVAAAAVSGEFGFLAEVARAGGGVALLPTFLGQRALVRVLPGFALGGAPLYLVSRPLRPVPPRVAALRGFLLERLRAAER